MIAAATLLVLALDLPSPSAAAGVDAFRRADYATAERHFRAAFAQPPSADLTARARLASNLSATLRHLGRLADAEPYAQLTVELRTRSLGANHPDTGIALNNLAQLHDLLGRTTEAELEYRAALRATATSRADSATVWNNLGELYRAQRRFTEAQRAFDRSLAIRRSLVNNDTDLAITLNNLARLAEDQGRDAQANEIWQQALSLDAAPPSQRAIVFTHLARLRLRAGHAHSAHQYLLDARRHLCPDRDPLAASALEHVAGQLALHLNSPALALEAFTRAITLRTRHLGPEHPTLAPLLTDQAAALHALGRHRDAKQTESRLARILANRRAAPAVDIRALGE